MILNKIPRRKPAGKTKVKGLNHHELWPMFPELAAAFMAHLLDQKKDSVPYRRLYDSYLGKNIEQVTGRLRSVQLDRIISEVKAAGYNIEIKITKEGRPIGEELPPCPWPKSTVLKTCLGGRTAGLKDINVGPKLFDKDVYMVEEFYYTVVDNQEAWPELKHPELVPVKWEVVPTNFDAYGYLLLKGRVHYSHLQGVKKQRIKVKVSES